jgi:hypothetical protein
MATEHRDFSSGAEPAVEGMAIDRTTVGKRGGLSVSVVKPGVSTTREAGFFHHGGDEAER